MVDDRSRNRDVDKMAAASFDQYVYIRTHAIPRAVRSYGGKGRTVEGVRVDIRPDSLSLDYIPALWCRFSEHLFAVVSRPPPVKRLSRFAGIVYMRFCLISSCRGTKSDN
ncbi:hypothetical protein Trydic_g18114 [Trypoxylus dichotomus]